MEIALGIVAVAAVALIAVSWPGVMRQRRIDIAVKNLSLQLSQVGYLMEQLGTSAARAADLMREFVAAWPQEVIAHYEQERGNDRPEEKR